MNICITYTHQHKYISKEQHSFGPKNYKQECYIFLQYVDVIRAGLQYLKGDNESHGPPEPGVEECIDQWV